MVKAGGVKLIELQVGHPAPRAPGDRDAVATGTVRVRGVAIGLAGAPGCEHDGTCADRLHCAVAGTEQVGAADS